MLMTEKCKRTSYKYNRRTYEGLAPLIKEVQKITETALGARGFTGTDILSSWKDIVGADLAQGITPEKLTFERDKRTNGTLYVKSVGGAFAMIFEHQKNRVIEQINCFFGYPAVAQIKIRQGALKLKRSISKTQRSLNIQEKKELAERVSLITDENLRERAFRVGQALLLKK